jgi:hypothetical protein
LAISRPDSGNSFAYATLLGDIVLIFSKIIVTSVLRNELQCLEWAMRHREGYFRRLLKVVAVMAYELQYFGRQADSVGCGGTFFSEAERRIKLATCDH